MIQALGRTSIAPLSKMGLVVSKKTISKLYITKFGKNFLDDHFDIGNIFLEYFFKWTLPNPDNKNFSAKNGFNIRPFIATLHIINNVNKEWKKLGYEPIGISKQEFNYFIPTTINYKDITKTVEEIIELRNSLQGKSREEQNKIKKEFFIYKTKSFFEDPEGEHLEVNFQNLKDYGDNALRYFRITRFFYIRGGGFYIDLEPRRHVEIKSLLNCSNGEGLEFDDLNAYLEFLDSEVVYPWDTSIKLKTIIQDLRNNIHEINSSLEVPKIVKNICFELNIEKLSLEELKSLASELRKIRIDLLEYKNHLKLTDAGEFEDVIKELANIHGSDKLKSVYLEYLITLCLHAINDALKIQPNYPVGDDNEPTFTAPSNVPDIECFYKNFNMICEVTMLSSRDQWINEGQPVMRHLRDFELTHSGDNICLFIAPKIHRDTFNTFSFSNKYEYEGKKQRIIPLNINQFIKILKRVLIKKKQARPISYSEIKDIFDKLYSIVIRVESVDAWSDKSNEFLNNYMKTGVLS